MFGFNQTDAGFGCLLALFVVVPLINLAWIAAEIKHSVMLCKHGQRNVAVFGPTFAVLFFLEAVAIDLYLLSQVRM